MLTMKLSKPEILTKLNNGFRGLSFEPSTHTYSDGKGTKFTSCTEFVKKFEFEKDWDEIRNKSALKKIHKEKGTNYVPTKEELEEESTKLKAEWEKTGQYAATLGTEVHAVMEYLWQGKDYTGDEEAMAQFPGMKEEFLDRKFIATTLFKRMSKRYVPIANEFRVFDADLKLAGTIDFIAYDMVDNKLVIIDWKSSKKFNKQAWKPDEVMKYPFNGYDDCNVNHYSLQLSLYKYIIEKNTDLKVGDLILFQLPKPGTYPESCNCNDMTKEINFLFNS